MSGGGSGDGAGTGDASSVGLGDPTGGLASVAAATDAAIGNYGFGNTVSGFAPASVSAPTGFDPGNTSLGGYYGYSQGPQGTVSASPPGYASNADAAAAASGLANMGISANPGLGTGFGQATPGGQIGSSVTSGIANTAPSGTNFGTNFGQQGNTTGIGPVGFVNGNDPGLANSVTGRLAAGAPGPGQPGSYGYQTPLSHWGQQTYAQNPPTNLSPQQHQTLVQALQALHAQYGGGGTAAPQSGQFGQVSPAEQQAIMAALSGQGTPSNFGQIGPGVNSLAQYGIGPTMGVGMGLQGPNSGFGSDQGVAGLGPQGGVSTSALASPQAQNTNGPMGSLGFPGTQGYGPQAAGGQGRGVFNPSSPHFGYGGAYGFAGLSR